MSNESGGKLRFYSPLRYPGGKRRLCKQIEHLFKLNNYVDSTYIEPFAGGAGIALSLLYNGRVKEIHLNDLDISIYSFWKAILSHNEEFIHLIKKTPVNLKEWEKQKEIQKNATQSSLLELGFSTFFLNRTNVSGVLKGGPIGGKKQTGRYKIDARFNKEDLIPRIKKIADYKNSISTSNLCVLDFISTLKTSKKPCFIYFDPPYYIKGPELYQNHLTEQAHEKISKMISEIDFHYWIVTYDNVPEIIDLYSDFRQEVYSLKYSAGKAQSGEEVMIFSHNLNVDYEEDKIRILL